MDEPVLATWRAVGERLERMDRGATAALARALRIDASYLRRKLQGAGEPTVRQAQVIAAFLAGEESDGRMSPPEANIRVPVYGYAAASSGDRIALNSGEILDWMELPRGLTPPGDVFVIRAFGSSMEPRILDGEMLVIQRKVPPIRDRDAVIEFSDGSAVVKTYKGQRDGRVFAEQYNPNQRLDYDATSVKAIHKVFCRL